MRLRIAAAIVIVAATASSVSAGAADAPQALTAPASTRTQAVAVRLDPPQPNVPTPTTGQQVLDLLNAERAKVGADPVVLDDALSRAAEAHSRDQASRGSMSHTGSDGSNAGQRVTRAGFVWRTWGENVAYGYTTAAAVMSGWMNSPGHRANNLNSAFTHVGVGLANSANGTPYWTLVLATPM